MKTILILAAAAAAFSASPAIAQDAAGASQLVVSSAGLDLATAGGVARLDRRIRTAVEIACGPTSDADLHGQHVVRQCRIDTLALARAQRDRAIAAAQGRWPIQLAGR